MSAFLEFHLIQNFAPSNLNRDDTGSPKDAIFGGQRRARVSSQCFKRSIRMMARDHDLIPSMHLGVRTKRLKEILLERLVDRDPRDAEAKIEAALGAAGLKLKEDGKTEYLLFLGEGEIAEFASLVAEHWDALPIGGRQKRQEGRQVRVAIRTGQEGPGVARRWKSRRCRTVRPNAG
ncbi:type I-E CRISPR-associated protein Cas7/Cse4/CasC [Achromobacter xylosoxidans]|uniref:type I-E CRISPR-associated protein Cas7/Cse4/CasC n=1 Tax=Alcaligenes xylosoxydans xylosoxydans TaxID=85698 RepID=UPI0038FCD729